MTMDWQEKTKPVAMIPPSDIRYKKCAVIETLPKIQRRELKDTPYTLVAAIDLGTTYSGYAFSSKCDYTKSPLNVHMVTWKAGSGDLTSMKSSTCILFNPDETFDSFGFEAEDKYARLMDENSHHDWYFFRRFKMSLYDQQEVSRTMKLYAQNQKPVLAMNVFTAVIKHLKDHLLGTCEAKKVEVFSSDVRWVLTLPAIWSDRSKQFMRECAQQAGIPGHQLVMSLEAEAAALYCKYLPIKDLDVGQKGDNIAVFEPGTKYMVVDIGGGTVDITIHEVQEGLQLKEIHMANGGDWGGTMVDREFESILTEILSEEVFEKFKTRHEADYLELKRIFESKKRSISTSEDAKITFTLPVSLMETYQDMRPNVSMEDNISANKKYANNVTWKSDKLRIKSFLAKGMFSESIQKIINHLDELQKEPEVSEIQAIILVGGYAECPLLQEKISTTFIGKRLIVPHESGLAVLKGAVINGHELDAVTERISRFTYGVKTCTPFIPFIHPEMYRLGGYCYNIFSSHVRMGEHIRFWEKSEPKTYYVMFPDQTSLNIELYVSLNANAYFVTEPGCECIGCLVVKMPDTRKGLNRGVDVELKFGGAEIELKVRDRDTEEDMYAYFDFLA